MKMLYKNGWICYKVITLCKNFPMVKRSALFSLNPFSISYLGVKVTGRGTPQMNLHHSGENRPGKLLWMLSRRIYTLLEAMMISIWDGRLYVKKETNHCWSTVTSSIPYTQSWVSETLSGPWFSSTTMSYTGTSKHRWISWKYTQWESIIDMKSKSSINSSSWVSRSSGLQICHNTIMEKTTLMKTK